MQIDLDKHDVESILRSIVEEGRIGELNVFLSKMQDFANMVYHGFRLRIHDLVVEDTSVAKITVRFVGDVKKGGYWFINPRRRLFKEIRALLDSHYDGRRIRSSSLLIHTVYYKPYMKREAPCKSDILIRRKLESGVWIYIYSECSLADVPELIEGGRPNGIHSVCINFKRISKEGLENLIPPDNLPYYS